MNRAEQVFKRRARDVAREDPTSCRKTELSAVGGQRLQKAQRRRKRAESSKLGLHHRYEAGAGNSTEFAWRY